MICALSSRRVACGCGAAARRRRAAAARLEGLGILFCCVELFPVASLRLFPLSVKHLQWLSLLTTKTGSTECYRRLDPSSEEHVLHLTYRLRRTFPPRDGNSVGHRSPPSTVLHQRKQTRVGNTNPKTESPQTQKPRQTATTSMRLSTDRGRRVRPCRVPAERICNGHLFSVSAGMVFAVWNGG